MKIKIITPYFGSWPSWFPFFIKSCENNPDIDWLLIGDQVSPIALPQNVTLEITTFKDYCEFVSDKLGIVFKPNSVYKLCDLKPALGKIYKEILTDYDFWGFGDIDLIYGDLQGHINRLNLDGYDAVSFHGHRLSGHLCLFRNDSQMTLAYQKVKGWKEILEDPEHRCFDEKHFNGLFISHKSPKRWLTSKLNGHDNFKNRAFFHEVYSTPYANIEWRDGTSQFPTSWILKDKKLFANDDSGFELPYLHFMTWKKYWPHDYQFDCNPNKTKDWLIDKKGFHALNR
ncbi:MAG: hypothetical protein OXE99_15385 [Cellvibrionales bacterium]|nr:hypothetical protein [Cellvibrionales bacterium]